MPRMKRKQYTTEFKEEAVRAFEKDRRPVKVVADELGINPTLLQKWRVQLAGARTRIESTSALAKDDREELLRLRKRVAVLPTPARSYRTNNGICGSLASTRAPGARRANILRPDCSFAERFARPIRQFKSGRATPALPETRRTMS